MGVDELARELLKRAEVAGKSSTLDDHLPVAKLVNDFELQLRIEDFSDPRGVVLRDLNGRSVAVYSVVADGRDIRCSEQPFTDILVVADGAMTLGWLDRSQLVAHERGFVAHSKSVRKMPKIFDFAVPCPHFVGMGGFWSEDDEAWVCWGCNERIVDAALSSN